MEGELEEQLCISLKERLTDVAACSQHHSSVRNEHCGDGRFRGTQRGGQVVEGATTPKVEAWARLGFGWSKEGK